MQVAMSPMGPGRPISGLRRILALAAILGATFGVGAIGIWVAEPSVSEWYESLNKPSFNPPNWLFAPVWAVLYVCMSLAAWLAWQAAPEIQRAHILSIYGGQLLLNLLWPVSFFGLRLPLLAYIDCLLLGITIILMILQYRRVSRLAG